MPLNSIYTTKALRLKGKNLKLYSLCLCVFVVKSLLVSSTHYIMELASPIKKTAKAETPLQFGTMKTKNGNYLSNINKSEI